MTNTTTNNESEDLSISVGSCNMCDHIELPEHERIIDTEIYS